MAKPRERGAVTMAVLLVNLRAAYSRPRRFEDTETKSGLLAAKEEMDRMAPEEVEKYVVRVEREDGELGACLIAGRDEAKRKLGYR